MSMYKSKNNDIYFRTPNEKKCEGYYEIERGMYKSPFLLNHQRLGHIHI